MRRHRAFPVAAATVGSVLVLSTVAGCGSGASGRDGTGSDGTGPGGPSGQPGRWTISALEPGSGSYEQCLEDPFIEESFLSADYPASLLGLTLTADATAEDAQRIAACLRQVLPEGEVTVTGPEAG